jgi:hypothetical protein
LGKRDKVNRIDLHNTGLFGDGNLTSARTPQKYWGTILVAAYNASPEERAGADYVCDGTADDVQINAAMTDGGSAPKLVKFTSGTFTLAAPIVMKADCAVEGQGAATLIRSDTTSNFTQLFDCNTVNRVELRNFRLKTQSALVEYGVSILACNDVQIFHLYFDGSKHQRCIYARDNCTRLSVAHCHFVDCDLSLQHIAVTSRTDELIRHVEIVDNIFIGSAFDNPSGILLTGDENGSGDIPTADAMLLRDVVVSGNQFRGYTGGSVSVRGNFVNAEAMSNLSVDGNTIRDAHYGVLAVDCAEVSIGNNTLNNVYVGIAGTNSYSSETGGGSRYYTITNNTINSGDGLQGIAIVGPYSDGGDDSTLALARTSHDYRTYANIVGNSIRGSAGEGITCQTAANINITGNTISDCAAAGISAANAWLLNIAGNDLVENEKGIELLEVYDVNIAGNYINNSLSYAIWLRDAHRIGIRSNKLYGTDDYILIAEFGAGATGGTHIVIDGNSFYGGATVLYRDQGDVDHLAIMRNTFEGYQVGFEETDLGPLATNSITNLVLESNYYTESNVVESQIRAGYRQSSIADGSPGNAEFNGRSSLIQIAPASGSPDTDIESLTSLKGMADQIYIFKPALVLGTATSITFLHGNNIHLAGGIDFMMDDSFDRLVMHYDGIEFTELSRSKAPGYTYGSELVVNGNVETGSPANWTASGAGATWSTTQALSATHSLKINAASCSWTSDFITVSSSTAYLAQAAFLGTPAAGYTKFRVDWYTSGDVFISSETRQLVVTMPAWTRHQLFITSPGTAAKAKLVFIADASAPTFELYADDFSMRTYV